MAEQRPPLLTRILDWIRQARARRGLRDLAGIALIALGAITLLTLLKVNTGALTQAWAGLLQRGFGVGAFLIALILIAVGVPILLNSSIRWTARNLFQVLCAEVAFFGLLALIHALSLGSDPYALSQSSAGGGALGWVLAELSWRALGSSEGLARLVSILFWLAITLLTGLIALKPLLARAENAVIVTGTGRATLAARQRPTPTAEPPLPAFIREPAPRARQATLEEAAREPQTLPAKPRKTIVAQPAPTTAAPAPPSSAKPAAAAPRPPETKAKVATPAPVKVTRVRPKPAKPVALPPIELLKTLKPVKGGDADAERQAAIIEETLVHFGLTGKVVETRRGPTVTQFGVEPGYLEKPAPNGEKRLQRVRVSQIANLQNDLALALQAQSLRIEAPIPGRGLVGIEVPNTQASGVDLRSLMESEAFRNLRDKSPLAIALGRDVSGTEICADLARMPHLLIAGTTGSGKSVCISAIATCLTMTNRPEDLKLVMVDPKMVELSRFAGLPHILGKPESESERIPAVLQWVTREMDSRYKKFAEVGSRHLSDYNEILAKREEPTLPRIVVMIDELADLMLQQPVETEKTLCRLAQMARATGIHLIVATQRPSVDVVTGLIKANFPARIAFAVASATDSRVIIDQNGADALLGRGDMLFLNPEAGHPLRAQGCFVSDREVEQIISWWKKQAQAEKAADKAAAPEGGEEPYVANRKPELDNPWDMLVAELAAERAMAGPSRGKGGNGSGGGGDDGGDDDLVQRAMEIIRTSGNASTSLLQRKLRIGYPRAARLMEELQEMGYVGGAATKPTKGREIKVIGETPEDDL
ncbi:MAG: DNA translocase FtsK [Thermoflexales bacterium]|nr:DNA translocase FtsK [Thermoflexales bacterium]